MFFLCSRPAPVNLYSPVWRITREELESLIAEALMRDGTFRPKRRNWSETRSEDERRARIIAGAIVTYLDRCGLYWEKQPALPPHRTPGD